MPYVIKEVLKVEPHHWAVVHCKCNPNDKKDSLVGHVAVALRNAYGEGDIVNAVNNISIDSGVEKTFDMKAIKAAFRKGLPDARQENKKPGQLTNYRSESAEIVAKSVLEKAHKVLFPTDPQRGKKNANQPVLGFDSWGILRDTKGKYVLVLVQVKGTHDKSVPPKEAHTLADECREVPIARDQLCRELSVLTCFIKDKDMLCAFAAMLEDLGKDNLPRLAVAPVIVRGGATEAHIDDLKPCREMATKLDPVIARGVTVSIGANLNDFGKAVTECARAE